MKKRRAQVLTFDVLYSFDTHALRGQRCLASFPHLPSTMEASCSVTFLGDKEAPMATNPLTFSSPSFIDHPCCPRPFLLCKQDPLFSMTARRHGTDRSTTSTSRFCIQARGKSYHLTSCNTSFNVRTNRQRTKLQAPALPLLSSCLPNHVPSGELSLG